jgi:hypothetical protein
LVDAAATIDAIDEAADKMAFTRRIYWSGKIKGGGKGVL